jgi:cytochrome c biogenesis protein CcdA
MTSGFAVVFGAFGLLIAPVAEQIQRHLPWVTVAIGPILVAFGGWLAVGRLLPGLRVAPTTGPQVTRTVTSMAIFGAAYAVASLSCTIGPFLAIVVASFRAGSLAEGVGLFVAYTAGMGLAVAAAALAVALSLPTMIVRWRRLAPTVSRFGGLLLLLAQVGTQEPPTHPSGDSQSGGVRLDAIGGRLGPGVGGPPSAR